MSFEHFNRPPRETKRSQELVDFIKTLSADIEHARAYLAINPGDPMMEYQLKMLLSARERYQREYRKEAFDEDVAGH